MTDFAAWEQKTLAQFAEDAQARMKAQDAVIAALRTNLNAVVQLLHAEEALAMTITPDTSYR
jgi:hypothetical protein